MKMKINNLKAIERISIFLTKEDDADNIAESLGDAYYLLAQQAARIADQTAEITAGKDYEETMYTLNRLKEVMEGSE